MVYKGGKANRSPSCVFVGNLPEKVEESEIRDLFEKYGTIREIDIKKGRTSNYTSYAFLDFEEVRCAEEAVEARDGYEYEKNRLRVEIAGERKSRRNRSSDKHDDGGHYPPPVRTDYRLVISHLPRGCRWHHLKDHMRKAGPVGYVSVEGSRGYVDFMHRSDMKYALRKLDRTELRTSDDSCRIKVRLDESYRSDRRRRSRSRSRSRTRRRSPSRSYSRRNRSRSRSRNRQRSRSSPSIGRDRRIDADEFHAEDKSSRGTSKSPN
ncbi:bifunctional RNA recognition motif domain/Nucleotide-binding alpha-beta plait domain superfamily/RNA-binding domain superfamily [Babesia duncani]|uniref:Bifunctional RNA recognition motif domain/Nucleotide-binding alpha-beta plait domain superfamily/RNA-binding domain superfamily n=1 Tax=Babesia duncani TaxID=323732 RepID=A0AAD9UMK6_9APIC|nr:bifunctional RNA recognition motif domain/Nucleotide-binding alpha-beta plait domain superfamily/RNA-binding domain superfamily [Babesia duncani]KAK2196792.1 bifunctional RNA recognition motif domain/Nucleotide-binding alpha-beta plait domain superfamily/RNA-binding domain superfamily [Babesia duncani]